MIAPLDAPPLPPCQLPTYAVHLFQPAPYKVLYGGRGATRSWTVARVLLIRAAQRPTRILCTREMQTSIHDSVHQLLRDQIILLGIEGYEVTDREIRHRNGSAFLFEGLRYNPTKIKSTEGIDICWVEEAERITKESWDILLPTIRKDDSEIWINFNPDQEEDATYQMFIVNPPPGTWSHFCTWRDNPWLTDKLRALKDHAYATDPDAAEHVWGGKTRQVTDAQIMRGKWIVEEFEPVPYHTERAPCPEMLDANKHPTRKCPHGWDGPYHGLDFGFADDPTAGVRCWIHGTILYVEYELYRLHLDIDHTAPAVKKDIPGAELFTIRADSARPDTISYLRRHGLPRIVSVKKGAGSVEDGIAHLRSYTRIVVHSRCKNTIDEMKHYSYKVDEKSGDVLTIIIDKFNHCMDALRYAVEPMVKPQRRVGMFVAGAAPRPQSPAHA